ncbi:MAG: putative PEP-binding protein, partial [Cyclobacteriaceae bacterium]
IDFVAGKIISKEEAIAGMDLDLVDRLLHPEFDPDKISQAEEMGSGLPASPGAASGQVYFNSKAAEAASTNGQEVILVRIETSPEDIQGMISSNGVLTARGGMTSHAAVVARGMGKCCVTSCSDMDVDEEVGTVRIGQHQIKEGDFISLDGSSGKVYLGEIETKSVNLNEDFSELMRWADEISRMKVLANADNPGDAERARSFGAQGIGLCRTEHMFFEGKRVLDIREMIMAKTDEKRKIALEKLFPHQKEDFKGIFKVMEMLPVTIRLLDPPLHEFLPKGKEEMQDMATQLGVTYEEVVNVTAELEEVNPMMGLRGCRLGLIYPEIYEMQTRAIVIAALEVKNEEGFTPVPEIMIPLVGNEAELSGLRKRVEALISTIDTEGLLNIKIGTMIEVPRACMVADRIAAHADYFSFGTNDLTQMTLGYSRDDAGKFIRKYKELKVLEADPFQQIDTEGVGELIKIAIEKGKSTASNLKIGVCGEHGGESISVAFFNSLPIDYVSCSPYRVPKARLAAAQAELNRGS